MDSVAKWIQCKKFCMVSSLGNRDLHLDDIICIYAHMFIYQFIIIGFRSLYQLDHTNLSIYINTMYEQPFICSLVYVDPLLYILTSISLYIVFNTTLFLFTYYQLSNCNYIHHTTVCTYNHTLLHRHTK